MVGIDIANQNVEATNKQEIKQWALPKAVMFIEIQEFSSDFHWFSLMFTDFHWFSLIFTDFHWFPQRLALDLSTPTQRSGSGCWQSILLNSGQHPPTIDLVLPSIAPVYLGLRSATRWGCNGAVLHMVSNRNPWKSLTKLLIGFFEVAPVPVPHVCHQDMNKGTTCERWCVWYSIRVPPFLIGISSWQGWRNNCLWEDTRYEISIICRMVLIKSVPTLSADGSLEHSR